MNNNDQFELIIGGDYMAQPKHKLKIVPEDFLVQFHNVKPYKLKNIIDFANNYSFGGYIGPDAYQDPKISMIDKFSKIQNKYNPIIKKLIDKNTINYSDIHTINEDLKMTSPHISLRETINNLQKIEEAFSVYVLKNVQNEDPIYDVKHHGLFDRKGKDIYINVKQHIPANSRTKWYFQRIKDGVIKIRDIFSSDIWETQEEYLNAVILKNGNIKLDSHGQPIAIEMNFWLGKTDFAKEELASAWSPTTAESFIAKRIWDYLNTEYRGSKFKLCKICSNLHTGRSQDYCSKKACRKEWDNIRKKHKKK